MRKLIIALLVCAGLNAQDFSKWSLEMAYGENLYIDQIGTSRTSSLVNTGLRYMITPTFGVQTFGQFDMYRSKDYPNHLECEYRSYGVSARLEVFKRLLNINRFSFSTSAGIGGNFMWLNHQTYKKERTFQYTAAASVFYGLGKKYKWGALKAEYRVLANTLQDKTLNGNFKTIQNGINSYVQNLTLGFAVYFGTSENKQPGDFYKEEVKCCENEIVQDINIYPVELKTEMVIPNEHVFFREGKAVIDKEGLNAITNIFEFLENNPYFKVEAIGSSCYSHGSDTRNLKLSTMRAENVANKLISMGINKERVSWRGTGKDKKFSPSDSDAQKRVDFIIYK